MVSVRTHAFLPDPSAMTWDGQPGCASCPLPKQHEIHNVEMPDGDVSDRLLGEHDLDEGAA